MQWRNRPLISKVFILVIARHLLPCCGSEIQFNIRTIRQHEIGLVIFFEPHFLQYSSYPILSWFLSNRFTSLQHPKGSLLVITVFQDQATTSARQLLWIKGLLSFSFSYNAQLVPTTIPHPLREELRNVHFFTCSVHTLMSHQHLCRPALTSLIKTQLGPL